MPLYDIPKGEEGTKSVLRMMSQLTNEATADPKIIEFTSSLIRNVTERDQAAEAKKIFKFVRNNIRYVKDPYALETIFSPDKILGLEKNSTGEWLLKGRMSGDCDCMCCVVASMFQTIGLPTRFVAIKTPTDTKNFSHVYVETKINNKWYAVDTIVKKPFGWSYPFILQKLIIENLNGKISKSTHSLAGIGEPFMVVRGIDALIRNVDNVEMAELGEMKSSLNELLSSPLAVMALFGLFFYGLKLFFRIKV